MEAIFDAKAGHFPMSGGGVLSRRDLPKRTPTRRWRMRGGDAPDSLTPGKDSGNVSESHLLKYRQSQSARSTGTMGQGSRARVAIDGGIGSLSDPDRVEHQKKRFHAETFALPCTDVKILGFMIRCFLN